MSIDELKREVEKIKWWHTIDLGSGVITPGSIDCGPTLKSLGMPEDLRGMTVLDIGAWDGFYSFEAERRGAKRVLATDSFCWGGSGGGRIGWGTKAGFELARKALKSKVEDMYIDVLDISPDKVGTFDIVLFLGVLYHMRHPLLALERVFSVTGKQLILETHVDMFSYKRPAMVFYPGAELSKDPTNWWGPNPAAVREMLKTVGFKNVEIISGPGSLKQRMHNALLLKREKGEPFFPTIQRSRMAFHAWR